MQISNDVLDNLVKRVDGESASAYQAFCAYARLLPTERVFDKAIPVLAASVNLSESTLRQYAVTFKWNDRCALIDSYLLKLDIQERHAQNNELNLQFIETNRQLKLDQMNNNRRMMELTTKVLNWAMLSGEEKIVEWITDKDGNQVPVKTEVVMKFNPSHIPAMVKALKTGIELVNEIPTEVINNRPISDKAIDEIEDFDELQRLEAEVDKEMQEFQSDTVN